MKKYDYSYDTLYKICKESFSYRECLLKLGCNAAAGGHYQSIKNKINEYRIDISHFTHQSSNKGKTLGPKRPLTDYLSNKKNIQSYKLKERLIKEKIFDHKCMHCKKTKWMNNKIPLELHHIDGNNKNNQLSNLSLLCPNCHALTNNYRGKKSHGRDSNPQCFLCEGF